jgi:hypothetical protein
VPLARQTGPVCARSGRRNFEHQTLYRWRKEAFGFGTKPSGVRQRTSRHLSYKRRAELQKSSLSYNLGKVEEMPQRCRPEGRRYTKPVKSGFGEILRSGSSLRMTILVGWSQAKEDGDG